MNPAVTAVVGASIEPGQDGVPSSWACRIGDRREPAALVPTSNEA